MRKTNKKGFTIVELVIVIAVVAILAAVLVPTFVSVVKKANESKDTQLVRNLNTALAVDTEVGKHETMQSALEAAAKAGYDVAKINASATDNEILWDSKNDCFVYKKDSGIEYIPNSKTEEATDGDFWKIVADASAAAANKNYNSYVMGTAELGDMTVANGLDVGENTVKGTITFKSNETKTVTIRTNGGTLAVNAHGATVNHYGKADKITITAVAPHSYHEYGEVLGNIELANGRVVMETGSKAAAIKVTATKDSVDNGTAVVSVDTTASAVSVVVPEAVKTAIETKQGDNKITANTDKIVTDSTVIENMDKFAGGLGTEESPYLIATAEQLLSIEDGNSYLLIKNIDLSKESAISGEFCTVHVSNFRNGTLKGNGYDIALAEGASFVRHAENSTFEDISFTFGYKSGRDQTIIQYSSNLTMTNVYTYGTASMTGNVGLFCIYLGQGVNNTYATFTNCINYAAVNATGYNALFVGYVFVGNKTTLNFKECKNAGTFVSVEGALYLANCAGSGTVDGTTITMNIENSGNTEAGILRVTNINKVFNPYICYFASGTKVKVIEDGSNKVEVTDKSEITAYLPTNCFVGPNDNGLRLVLNEDNTFTVEKSSYDNVVKYVVRIGLYSTIISGNVGTQLEYVTETITGMEGNSCKTTLKNLSFTQKSGTNKGTVGDNASVVEVGGIEYYYFNVANCGLKDGTQKPTIFEVLAYDESGVLVSSYKLSIR